MSVDERRRLTMQLMQLQETIAMQNEQSMAILRKLLDAESVSGGQTQIPRLSNLFSWKSVGKSECSTPPSLPSGAVTPASSVAGSDIGFSLCNKVAHRLADLAEPSEAGRDFVRDADLQSEATTVDENPGAPLCATAAGKTAVDKTISTTAADVRGWARVKNCVGAPASNGGVGSTSPQKPSLPRSDSSGALIVDFGAVRSAAAARVASRERDTRKLPPRMLPGGDVYHSNHTNGAQASDDCCSFFGRCFLCILSIPVRFGVHCCCCVPMQHPEAFFVQFWKVAMRVAMLFSTVIVPLEVAFAEHFVGIGWAITNLVVDMAFLIELPINFRTGFFRDGMLVMDPVQVARHYVRGRFTLDLLVAVPYAWLFMVDAIDGDYDYHSTAGTMVRMLRTLRLLRVVPRLLRNDAQRVKRTTPRFCLDVLRFNPSVARVLQVLCFFILSCHWLGCIWWLIGTTECNIYEYSAEMRAEMDLPPARPAQYTVGALGFPMPQLRDLGGDYCRGRDTADGWGPSSALQRASFATKYNYAFLWGASFTTGFVPYDVEPESDIEVFYTTLACFVGLFIGIVTIAASTIALETMDARSMWAHSRLEEINRFLVLQGVPSKLSTQILEYFHYEMRCSHRSAREVQELRELPHELNVRLTMVLFHDLITYCSFFHPLSSETVVAIVQDLRPAVACPGQLVMVEGHKIAALHFIRRGVVRVWIKYNEPVHRRRLLATLGDNDFFGERALTAEDDEDAIATATCQCASYCDLLTITREQCEELLKRDAINRRWRKLQNVFAGTRDAAAPPRPSPSTRAASFAPTVDPAVSSALADEKRALKSFKKLRRNNRFTHVLPTAHEESEPSSRRSDLEEAIIQQAHKLGSAKPKKDGYARCD